MGEVRVLPVAVTGVRLADAITAFEARRESWRPTTLPAR